jgi:hypothetical protein
LLLCAKHLLVEANCNMLSDAFGQHQDRTPTHGYAATREAAMAAFAKSQPRLRNV